MQVSQRNKIDSLQALKGYTQKGVAFIIGRGENMARKAKKKTPLQLEYAKQRKRVQQFIRRAEKRGYEFQPNIVPDKPKRITKASVERLKKLTPEVLYKKAEYGGEATMGEVVPALEGRKRERQLAGQRAAETRKALKSLEKYTAPEAPTVDYYEDYDDYDYYDTGYESDINVPDTINEEPTFFENTIIRLYREQLQWYNQDASKKLLNWINAVITKQGRKKTAKMIQDAQEAGVGLTRQEAYSEAKVTEYIGHMMDYLPEAGDFTKQDIMDALEYEESYEEPT